MEYKVVAIYDRSVGAYQPIHCVRSEGEALRGFIDALNNEASGTMYRHPDDFDLYVMGTMDDSTGKINAYEPTKIGDGKQLKQTRGE